MMTIIDPVEFAKRCEGLWAGEILLSSVDRNGMMQGYDIGLTKNVASSYVRSDSGMVCICISSGKYILSFMKNCGQS